MLIILINIRNARNTNNTQSMTVRGVSHTGRCEPHKRIKLVNELISKLANGGGGIK